MKKIYLAIILSVLVFHHGFSQVYTKNWASKYMDTSVSNTNINAMVTDASGNTYIAGYKIFNGDEYYQTHFFLLKINNTGAQKWIRYFDAAHDSIDNVSSIALDASNNIYITGKRVDTLCNVCTVNSKISDIITLKYSPDGTLAWLNRYHDSTYKLATSSDVKVGSNGSIIVTGNIDSYNFNTNQHQEQIIIQKIYSNGQTAWLKKLPSITGNSACFDNANNIIVAAASSPDGIYQTDKPMLLKFNGGGTLLWQTVFDEYEKNGQYYFVQCDSLNNIYANGQTDTIAYYNNPQILTAKYNSNGTITWSRKEANATTTLPHYYGDFKADNQGTTYITGTLAKNESDNDWYTTSYDNTGTRRWLNLHDDTVHGSDDPSSLIIDKAGNSYVCGYDYYKNGNYEIASVFYNAAGTQISYNPYKPGGQSNGFGQGIGIDAKGAVYVGGGYGFYSGSPGIVLLKYSVIKMPAAANTIAATLPVKLLVYPNPVSSVLKVSFTSAMPLQRSYIMVYDIKGVLQSTTLLNHSGSLLYAYVDVHTLPSGMYMVKISDGYTFMSADFIKR